MLRQRVITALVLLPLALVPLVWFPTPWMYAAYGVFALFAAWEWTTLMRLAATASRAAYLALVAATLGVVFIIANKSAAGSMAVLTLGVAWWLFAALRLPGYPGNVERRPWTPLTLGIAGLLAIVPAILALAELHAAAHGGRRILLLFLLVWAADIGAYFAGRAFGKRRLAPNVSPGKTLEGALGGFLLAMAMLAASPWVFAGRALSWPALAGLAAVVVAASIVGDLTESLFKRIRGIKDSSNLLPGHGGVLDRVDSILAAAPTFALGLVVLGL